MIATGFRYVKKRFFSSRVALGASFTLTIRIYGAALAYLTQLYLARTMGAEQLGIFVFAWTWLSILGFLTPIGFDTALVRFIPGFASNGQETSARGVIKLGYLSTLLVSSTVAILGVIFIQLFGELTQPYTNALTIALASVPVLGLINLQEGIARGFSWVYQVSMPSFALRPTLFLLLIFVTVYKGLPISGTWAIGAMSLACLVTWIYQYWRYRKSINQKIAKAKGAKNTRYWIASALPMVLVVSFEQLLANTDIVMLGIMKGPEATGIYNIAVRVVGITLFIFFAVSTFAAPRIAELHSQKKTTELIRFCNKVRLAIVVPTFIGILGLVFIGLPLLKMFGSEFTNAYYPMMILCIAVGMRAMAGPVDNLLTMTGHQKALAKVLGTVALLNFVANAILIPLYGMIGAACATSMSIILELVWVSHLAGSYIGFTPWLLKSKA